MKILHRFFWTIMLSGLILYCNPLKAQVFKAGISLGPTFSQIEGDDAAGYYKFGVGGGFLLDVKTSEKTSVLMEINFVQKGSASSFVENGTAAQFRIKMDYLEVPLIFNFHDRNGMIFSAGLSPARVINFSKSNLGLEDEVFFVKNPPKNFDLGINLGITYKFANKMMFNLKWTESIVPFRTDGNSNLRNRGQYHNCVTMRIAYLLSGTWNKGE